MKQKTLELSKALQFKIHSDGKVYGYLSQSDGEFYIATEVLSILAYFADHKKAKTSYSDLNSYLNKNFTSTLKNIPTNEECEAIVNDLIDSGFLIESHNSKTSSHESIGFSDPWIQWAMLADHIRSKNYEKAIKHHINDKSVVLDIGSGTGFLSACALFYGAKKVHAIEESSVADSILPALKKTGLKDLSKKITVHSRNSFDVKLPTDITLVVSELFGNDPFEEGLLSTLTNITKRLGKKNENIRYIPSKLQVYSEIIDLLEHPIKPRVQLYQNLNQQKKTPHSTQNIYESFIEAITNTLDFSSVSFPIQLLKNNLQRTSKAAKLGEISLNPISCSTKTFSESFSKNNELQTDEKTSTPLVLIWFRVTLTDQLSISSHPLENDYANHWSPIAIVLNRSLDKKITIKVESFLAPNLNAIQCKVFQKNEIIGQR